MLKRLALPARNEASGLGLRLVPQAAALAQLCDAVASLPRDKPHPSRPTPEARARGNGLAPCQLVRRVYPQPASSLHPSLHPRRGNFRRHPQPQAATPLLYALPHPQRKHHRERSCARPAATPGPPDKACLLAPSAQASSSPPRLNSRYSHARARLQSCRTVRGETFNASAASSSFKPPKYRISTTLLCRGLRTASFSKTSSSAIKSAPLSGETTKPSSRVTCSAPPPRLRCCLARAKSTRIRRMICAETAKK